MSGSGFENDGEDLDLIYDQIHVVQTATSDDSILEHDVRIQAKITAQILINFPQVTRKKSKLHWKTDMENSTEDESKKNRKKKKITVRVPANKFQESCKQIMLQKNTLCLYNTIFMYVRFFLQRTPLDTKYGVIHPPAKQPIKVSKLYSNNNLLLVKANTSTLI